MSLQSPNTSRQIDEYSAGTSASLEIINQKTAAVNIKSENPGLLSPTSSGILGGPATPSTGSVGIGQVQAPQPQTVQHHPPAPPAYNPQPVSSQVLMSPPVNSPPQPTPQPSAPPAPLVSSGPTSPIDGATSTTQIQIGNNGSSTPQASTASGQSTTNYYNNESGGNCSQYSNLDYNNGMSMAPTAATPATTTAEGSINNQNYSSWNGTGNNTVSYTQNSQSTSSGPELSNHPGYSKYCSLLVK